MKEIKKAVIPAAGYGIRFLPFTKSVPKEMLPVISKPVIQYVVEEAVASGITEILIIINRAKDCILDHFDKFIELEDHLKKIQKFDELKIVTLNDLKNIPITYIRQKEMLGSGGAIRLAKKFVNDEPFAVLFADDLIFNDKKPCTKQLIEAFYNTGLSIVGVQKVDQFTAEKCGVIKKGATKGLYTEIKAIVEKPKSVNETPSNLASLGRFVLTPDIFDVLEKTPLKNNEIFLTDAIDIIAKNIGAYAYEFEGIRYDTGDKVGFLKANIEYSLRDKTIGPAVKEYIKTLDLR